MGNYIDVTKTLRERDILLDSINDKDLDPADKDYQQILKNVNQLDLSMREGLKLNLETDRLAYENRKLDSDIQSNKERFEMDRRKSDFEMELERERLNMEQKRFEFEQLKHSNDVHNEGERVALEKEKLKSNEKVSMLTTIAAVTGALFSAGASMFNTYYKSRTGAEVIQRSTRDTFELDQNKVQSRSAANTMERGIKMFFDR